MRFNLVGAHSREPNLLALSMEQEIVKQESRKNGFF